MNEISKPTVTERHQLKYVYSLNSRNSYFLVDEKEFNLVFENGTKKLTEEDFDEMCKRLKKCIFNKGE